MSQKFFVVRVMVDGHFSIASPTFDTKAEADTIKANYDKSKKEGDTSNFKVCETVEES